MTTRIGAWLVTAFLACGATATSADVSEHFAIGIRLRVDPSITPRRIVDHLKSEAEAIWGQYGVQLDWTPETDPGSAPDGIALEASIERKFERRQPMTWPVVLGRVVAAPEAPSSSPIRVSFDATERVLALRGTARGASHGLVLDRELARALGRVLAHEIGHVLIGVPGHDQAGLMRSAFRDYELAEPDRRPFRLRCSTVERVRTRLGALTGDLRFVTRSRPIRAGREGWPCL